MDKAESVILSFGDATLTVPAEAAARAYLEKFMKPTPASVALKIALPRIGSPLEDGIYAGIARGRNGAPDHALIVGEESERMKWKAGMEWAGKYTTGWRAPFRKEQSLCIANVPELFKPEWYWSCEPYEAIDDCAWAQHFGGGGQGGYGRSGEFRVRLVRSVIVFD